MINTRFGSEVEIVKVRDSLRGDVTIRRKSDGELFDCHTSELRADKGYSEILAEMVKLEEKV